MRKALLFLVLTFGLGVAQAQSKSSDGYYYKTAVGIKIWDGAGISVKHFLSDKNAAEIIGYFYRQGFRLTGLYEIHGDINGAAGLKWYIGPGAHIGFYNINHGNSTVIGVDGVLGLDYKLSTAPINISLDWQPAFEFASGFGFSGSWGGLGIRYTF